MIYFVGAVLAITAVVQTILLYENKNLEDFYIEEQHLRAETVDRLKNFRNDYQHTYAIPDDAVEAATGVEIGDLNETVEAPWHLQPEEARRVLEAAIPHILTHRAESLRAATDCEVAQNIRVSLAIGSVDNG